MAAAAAPEHWVFVGTKADGRRGGRSLPVLTMDAGSGSVAIAHHNAVPGLAAPSWLAVTPAPRPASPPRHPRAFAAR